MINILAALAEVKNKVVSKQEKELNDLLRNDKEASNVVMYLNSKSNLLKAYLMAKEAHSGQYRWKGRGNVPYIFHIIDVVRIMMKAGIKDEHKILVAILHDTVEDGALSLKQIEGAFNKEVADHVKKMTLADDDGAKQNYYNKKIVKDSHHPVRDIKLADRLSKLKFIHDLRGGADKKFSNKLMRKYERLKQETERDYGHWYDKGTNSALQEMYEDYMNRTHSESPF